MNPIDGLRKVHTAAIDAEAGYQEAFEKADTDDLKVLFRDVAGLHGRHARELAQLLRQHGADPDADGSMMATVHTLIMDVRAVLGKLDASVLPGLIDGEERNIKTYDDALISSFPDGEVVLESQRHELRKLVRNLKSEAVLADT